MSVCSRNHRIDLHSWIHALGNSTEHCDFFRNVNSEAFFYVFCGECSKVLVKALLGLSLERYLSLGKIPLRQDSKSGSIRLNVDMQARPVS